MKKSLFSLFLALLVLLTGCISTDSYQRSIYSDNTKILKQGDSYTFSNRVGKADGNTLSLDFKGFYGKQTIWEISAEETCSVKLEINTKINKGKFKICLIDSDNNVSIISEGTREETIHLDILSGKNHIVIVGSNSKGKTNINITSSGDVKTDPIE